MATIILSVLCYYEVTALELRRYLFEPLFAGRNISLVTSMRKVVCWGRLGHFYGSITRCTSGIVSSFVELVSK